MVNAPIMIEKQNVILIKILIGARTHLNYYIKKNNYTYTKEFDKLRKEQNLAGHLRENSIIMCQMIFTSDQEFFNRIDQFHVKYPPFLIKTQLLPFPISPISVTLGINIPNWPNIGHSGS